MSCEHPSMVIVDHGGGPFGGIERTANRMCMKCGYHWYGPVDAIKEYTRAEWDAYVNDVDGTNEHEASSTQDQINQ